MARFARQGDGEPLMRLERPSTASSQTTAHVINACFNEILSQKPLDSKDINNLAVSKRENSETDYQDFYVDKLTKILDESKCRLEELSQVERHLMHSRARALAEDEKNLAILVNTCPSYPGIGLPQGPSQFHKYLDEELLARHNLLLPSNYFPQPSLCLQVSREMVKNPSSGKIQQMVASVPSRVLKPPWQDGLTSLERQSEKQAMSELHRKTVYLKNPKFSTDVHNTASFGPLKQQKTLKPQAKSKNLDSFLVLPKEVVFSVYHPGDVLQSVVEFRNICGVSRHLRLIPLKSDFFSVSPGCFPTEDGLIAPGMQCSFTITFTPDSLANYCEEMQVVVSSGEHLVVSLVGMRPFPELSLPNILDCGGCLVGNSKVWSTKCVNFGGEGKFKLIVAEGSQEDATTNVEAGSILVGPFLCSPKEFSLPAKGSVEIRVIFTPPGIGHFTEEFHMACDNGQMLSYTLAGMAEKIHIGCTQIRPSSVTEKLHFNPDSTPVEVEDIEDALTSSTNDESVEAIDVIEAPCVEFDSVNLRSSSFQTVMIHNFSNVNLAFTWRYYRPMTKEPVADSEENESNVVSLANILLPSENSPFSIYPSSGNILGRQSSTFVIRFLPEKLGSFVDMGYLTLTSRVKLNSLNSSDEGIEWIQLPDSKVSISCLQLQGTCQPYIIEMRPPAIFIPGQMPISTEIRGKFKVVNHSISSVCYQWNSYKSDGVSITVEPNHGRLVSGGSGNVEVVITGHSECSFVSTLECWLEGYPTAFSLDVHGNVKGPMVSVGCGSLMFGLVLFGRSSFIKFNISNESEVFAKYCFTQLVQYRDQEKGFMDHHCLSFSPSEGELSPRGRASVTVECKPKHCGHLRSILQLLVNGKPHKYISVEAEVQRPGLCLDHCQVHLENVYVGIPHKHQILLKNTYLIPAHFTWSSQAFGKDSKYCKVDIGVMTGRVGPKEEVVIPMEVTWTAQGAFDHVFLKCDILDMESPLFVSLSANVEGLSVLYRLVPEDNVNDADSNKQEVPLPSLGNGYLLDFGDDRVLEQPVSLYLKVVNNSAVPTFLETSISNFPAAAGATLPQQGNNSTIIVKSGSKTRKQEYEECVSSLLSGNRGLSFVVEPSCADLPAFGFVTLKITAYSNMWGEYSDQLACNVKGLETTSISIRAGFVGCPIQFPTTATCARTLVRFGTHPIGISTRKRLLKLKNSSPTALRVNWKLLNVLADDDKLINLVAIFGDPFPKIGNIMASKSYDEEDIGMELRHDKSDYDSSVGVSEQARDLGPDNSVVGRASGEFLGVLSTENGNLDKERDNFVQVHLEVHGGEETSNSPFNILPKQTVIPGHGIATVEVTYLPTSDAHKELGDEPCAYILGYISIDEANVAHVVRKTGYDIEPVRIDLMAGIQKPRFLLEHDDDKGLHFQYPASLLLQHTMEIKSEAFQVHHFTLINPTNSIQYFEFCTTSSHFFVTNVQVPSTQYSVLRNKATDQFIAVKPQASLQFSVKFSFAPSDIAREIDSPRDSNSCECYFEGRLQIKFSYGGVQEFPLSATVRLPILTVSRNECDMGTVLLGRSSSASFVTSNISISTATWFITIPPDLCDVITVSPQSGILKPHLHKGKLSSQLVNITFTPKFEISYKGSLTLQEKLTGQILSLSISGKGSADEQH